MNPSGGGFTGFSFGTTPTMGSAVPSAAPATTSSFAFGAPAASSAAPAAAVAVAAPTPAVPTASIAPAPTFGSGTSFTGFGATPASSGGSLSFGAPATTTSSAFSFGQAAPTAAPAPAAAPPSFGTPSSLSFGAAAPKPTLPSFGAATQQTNASTAALPTVASTANASLSGPAIRFSSSTTTTHSSAVAGNQMTFSQIEEMINKYTSELEEQEKVFINQATQVNSWDNLLNKNSKKIVELSNAVEKVKSEQKCLEDELKYIETQHTEVEEFIAPHSDQEKAQAYSLAENLDTQLRQMSEDLKEVIEHLNEVSKLQNSNDPIVQIGRILNAHMTSLQWIEVSTSQINSHLEEINKMYDTLRRDTERSLRLTYCD